MLQVIRRGQIAVGVYVIEYQFSIRRHAIVLLIHPKLRTGYQRAGGVRAVTFLVNVVTPRAPVPIRNHFAVLEIKGVNRRYVRVVLEETQVHVDACVRNPKNLSCPGQTPGEKWRVKRVSALNDALCPLVP